MKLHRFIFIAIVSTSCTEASRPTVKSTEVTTDWQTKILRRQKHTYIQSGLLDSTCQIEEYYVNGQSAEKINCLVTRQYDTKDNLTRERTFQLSKKKMFISEETIFEYDGKNQLIQKENTFQNVLSEMSNLKYNGLGQKIQEVKIQK